MADIGTVPGISVENQQTSLANGGCPTASKEDPNSLSMTEERTISYGLVDSCQKEMVSESIETGDKMQTDSTSLVNVNSDMHQNVSNVSCSASSVATSQDNNSLTEKTSVSSDISTSCEHSDMTPPLGEPSIRIKMLARVAVSDAHFKHQQRGEPDLSVEEKIEIAQKLLDESKVKFLSRFSQYLEIEDLEYFKDLRHIYEVDFYCKQVVKQKSGTFHKNRVKNRRYEAMKQLISEGDYFSEEEMKFREPYLYDQMIGQFMTDEEIQAKVDKSDLRFSSILIHHMDLLDENARFAREKEKEVKCLPYIAQVFGHHNFLTRLHRVDSSTTTFLGQSISRSREIPVVNANIVDPNQTPRSVALIWVRTICKLPLGAGMWGGGVGGGGDVSGLNGLTYKP